MSQLPADAPETTDAALAHINAVTSPTVDDLKLMVFLEALGQASYQDLARSAPNAEIRALLEANGREELAHAHRIAKVIKLLSGEDFAAPPLDQNRYARRPGRKLDRATLEMLIAAEDGGRALYETWADNIGHSEAAALMLQNAREEGRHGARAQEALGLFPG